MADQERGYVGLAAQCHLPVGKVATGVLRQKTVGQQLVEAGEGGDLDVRVAAVEAGTGEAFGIGVAQEGKWLAQGQPLERLT